MPVTAYVLIAASPGQTDQVMAALHHVEAVVDRYQVTGPYDIVTKIRAGTYDDVPSIVGFQIRTVPGVESTTTLVAFPSANFMAGPTAAFASSLPGGAGPQMLEDHLGGPGTQGGSMRNTAQVLTVGGTEQPAEPRAHAMRCMFPGCGRHQVFAYGFVFGIGRVPLCTEHAAGRDSA